jgi:Ras family protein T1
MVKASAGDMNPGIRIVVAGDRGTGKSSLIGTALGKSFPTNVRKVLPPTRLHEDFFPDSVPMTIIDTSSRYALFGYWESVEKEKNRRVLFWCWL